MESQNRRHAKNFLINPKYQMKLILALTLPGMAIVIAYSAVMYANVKENYDLLVELSPMTAAAKDQLYSELWRMMVMLGAASMLFLAVMAGLAIIFSHRTAGPLYHFKRVFQEIRDGNQQSRIRLRPRDDFQDVAETFNQMMDSQQQQLRQSGGGYRKAS